MSTTTTETHIASVPQRTLLGRAMIENALFSALSGITLTIGAPGLDSWLGVNAGVLAATGVGLMVFAVGLVTWARSTRWLRRGGTMAVTSDVLWVIGAVALIAFTDVLTSAGEITLSLVTGVVAVFAVMQAVGLARLGNKVARTTATFSIETSRIVDAPLDLVWSVVSDAGGYYAVVDSLEHTEIIAGHEQGMVRHCVDTKGREWNESCTLWEHGRTFRMTVDIDTYPPSFRALFKRVEGTWSVAPVDTGTVISMRFDGETKLGPLGKAAVSAMGRGAVLDGIMDGYETQIRKRLTPDQGR